MGLIASSPPFGGFVTNRERFEAPHDPLGGRPAGYRLRLERCFSEAFDPQGLGASRASRPNKREEDVTVVCDICGEEVDNSEALAQHNERMHASGEDEPKKEESGELPEEQEVPEAAPRPERM